MLGFIVPQRLERTKKKILCLTAFVAKKLNKIQNAEVCDATGDAIYSKGRSIKKYHGENCDKHSYRKFAKT